MAHREMEVQASSETVTEIERSCREDMKHFPDSTVELQVWPLLGLRMFLSVL